MGDSLTTASFSYWGLLPELKLQPLLMSPLPLVANTLPVASSTTGPPAAQYPFPIPGVT